MRFCPRACSEPALVSFDYDKDTSCLKPVLMYFVMKLAVSLLYPGCLLLAAGVSCRAVVKLQSGKYEYFWMAS